MIQRPPLGLWGLGGLDGPLRFEASVLCPAVFVLDSSGLRSRTETVRSAH